MQIDILRSGEVGQKLADAFTAIGHTVKVGTRSPEKVAPVGGKASIGIKAHTGIISSHANMQPSDAATFREIEVLANPL